MPCSDVTCPLDLILHVGSNLFHQERQLADASTRESSIRHESWSAFNSRAFLLQQKSLYHHHQIFLSFNRTEICARGTRFQAGLALCCTAWETADCSQP